MHPQILALMACVAVAAARCRPATQQATPEPEGPCWPSPCGPHSQCRVVGESPACICLPEYVGSPPKCRAECMINNDCASNRACINQKCRDPCPGFCETDTQCRVANHKPTCTGPQGSEGDSVTDL